MQANTDVANEWVDEAQVLFSRCMTMADDRLSEHLVGKPTDDQVLRAATAMLGYLAAMKTAQAFAKVETIATSIDMKEID